MAAVIKEAPQIGVLDIFVCFDLRNRRMRRITQKFQGAVSGEGSDCIGRISLPGASGGHSGDLAAASRAV
jgi:hypothetical protein